MRGFKETINYQKQAENIGGGVSVIGQPEVLDLDSKDNMGRATVRVIPGLEGQPGTVIAVVRPPRPQ